MHLSLPYHPMQCKDKYRNTTEMYIIMNVNMAQLHLYASSHMHVVKIKSFI